MTKTTLLLAALPAADAMAATPGSGAELAASLALALSALVLAYIGLRRGVTAGAHNRALEQLLVAEREARQQSEQALAASHDVLFRLVRRQDGAQAAPGAAESLRHALERCLVEHAQSHGVRYRFEAGVDPAAQPVGRAARLALFQVLQEVLAANAGRNGSADLHVRLNQGVRMLALDIQAGAAATPARAPAPLPDALARQVSTLGGILRVAAAPGRPTHWSLTLPAQRQSETAAIT